MKLHAHARSCPNSRLRDEKATTAVGFLRRAIAFFERHGITVERLLTDNGSREVDIVPALRDELVTHRHERGGAAPADLVFPTSTGSRRDKDNARERVIRPVVAHAEELLAQRGKRPLPDGVTAHKLRTPSRRSCSSGARTRPT